jgi:hypothetical protein
MFTFHHAEERRPRLTAFVEPRDRLSVGMSVLVIAGFSVLSWALVFSVVVALRPVLTRFIAAHSKGGWGALDRVNRGGSTNSGTVAQNLIARALGQLATYFRSRRVTCLFFVRAVSALETDISPDLLPFKPIFSRISPRVRP